MDVINGLNFSSYDDRHPAQKVNNYNEYKNSKAKKRPTTSLINRSKIISLSPSKPNKKMVKVSSSKSRATNLKQNWSNNPLSAYRYG